MNGLIMKGAQAPHIRAELRRRALESVAQNTLRAGTLGVGAGLTMRGMQGIINQLRRNFSSAKTTRKPSIVNIPVPSEEEDSKVAYEKSGGVIGDLVSSSGEAIKDFFTARNARSSWDVPGGIVPPILAGGVGIGAGWKGLDYLLDRSREEELESERKKVQQEYERALIARSKLGEDLDAALDGLWDKLGEDRRELVVKEAGIGAGAMNLYALWALISGVPAALWAYEATKARQGSTLLESARKKQRRMRENVRPTPVFAQPSPVQGQNPMKSAPDEEELEGAPLDKAARRDGFILAFAKG
jgi:hypothetical protein